MGLHYQPQCGPVHVALQSRVDKLSVSWRFGSCGQSELLASTCSIRDKSSCSIDARAQSLNTSPSGNWCEYVKSHVRVGCVFRSGAVLGYEDDFRNCESISCLLLNKPRPIIYNSAVRKLRAPSQTPLYTLYHCSYFCC